MHIFPAVDIKGGRAVRLLRGEADKETVYHDSPLEAARRWRAEGATWLHVVDLDGAFDGESENEPHIAEIARTLDAHVQVGGGIRTLEKAKRLLDAGVARVVVGTKALESRTFLERLLDALPGRVVVGVDARDGYVAVKGWVETTEVRAEDFLRNLAGSGAAGVVYTDIARDGALEGANVEAMRRAVEVTDVPVIASGGVTTLDDVRALAELPLFGVIIGKALYDGRMTLAQAQAASIGG